MDVSREAELWSAARTIDMHYQGRCAQCPPDDGDCRLLGWANLTLRAWEREHGRWADRRPSWEAVETALHTRR